MKPCPKCGGYNIKSQTPIEMHISGADSPRQVLGKWARTVKAGHTPLQGPVYIMCFDCLHKGPAMDCTGRTSEEVGQDKQVFKTIKRLWNEQRRKP